MQYEIQSFEMIHFSKYCEEIMRDEKFPKLANSLKEVQKLPEWSAIEKVMQEYVAAADSASGN